MSSKYTLISYQQRDECRGEGGHEEEREEKEETDRTFGLGDQSEFHHWPFEGGHCTVLPGKGGRWGGGSANREIREEH